MPSLNPVSGALGASRAAHLLKRLTYGPTPQQTAALAGMGAAAALNQLFAFTLPPPPSYEGDVWVTRPPVEGSMLERNVDGYLKKWWLGKMLADNTALEKLTFFLHTMITVQLEKSAGNRGAYWQNHLFQQYLVSDFGNANPAYNYKRFIRKTAVDNAMLVFLDGEQNIAGRPNENFAREFLELFTIGKGPTIGVGNYTNYTEDDIREIAKVFTGWTVSRFDRAETYQMTDPDTNLPLPSGRVSADRNGRVTNHDNKPKPLSAALSSATYPTPVITPLTDPATPESMVDEIDQLVNIIYAKDEAARFLMRRIHRFFVHWNITDEVETQIIGPLAQTFVSSGYRLRPVFERLFASEYFFDAAAGVSDDKFGAVIKSPMDLIFGTMRHFGVQTAPLNSAAFYQQMGAIERTLLNTGIDFWQPFDVAGYDPYHQAPGYSRNWISVNTLAHRYEFIKNLMRDDNRWGFQLDVMAWANSPASGVAAVATTPTTIGSKPYALDLVKLVVRQLLPLSVPDAEITQERLNYFAQYHLDVYSFNDWVTYWNDRNGMGRQYVVEMMTRLLNAVMQSPEYQLF
ncbi:MAG: DUF1800 domain-containing protein [Cytophagales bacterium]|jgi:uncharacterized protein (DUF1800 family)|nr:DUF1800 domain-containing protein [Cytophagales bacterium]